MATKQDELSKTGLHLVVGFQGAAFDAELRSIITRFKPAGIILFRRNIDTAEGLRALLSESRAFAMETLGRPLLVMVDQEGGPVQRLSPALPALSSVVESAKGGPEGVRSAALRCAKQLEQLGIQVNLAPVLDLSPDPVPGFLKDRCFGSDPWTVAELGRAWIEAHQSTGVSATAKHYPGLGSATLDPHHFAPVIHRQEGSSLERDLEPFREAITAGVHCFMTSHAVYPEIDPTWPATLSAAINRTLLRERLGFDGVLLSDDLDMDAVSGRYSWPEMTAQGLLAGVDIFLLCQRPENIEPFYGALRDSISTPGPADAHRQSVERIQRLFSHHGIQIG